MECRKHLCVWLLLGIMFLSSVMFVLAEATPEGPTTLTIHNTTRRVPAAVDSLYAIAGNVTQLEIIGQTVTQTWQGYYGNVTGTVTLDNSAGQTMYDWTLTDPEGEIYASQAEVTWTSGNVKCYDFEYDDTGDSSLVELDELEQSLGLNSDDVDGVNETFTETAPASYTHFFVGAYKVNQTCPLTHTYNGSEVKSTGDFVEFLLYDNTSDKIVYTAIIEETAPVGFDDVAWDFQMLVGEDGHNGSTGTTQYYFYVELE